MYVPGTGSPPMCQCPGVGVVSVTVETVSWPSVAVTVTPGAPAPSACTVPSRPAEDLVRVIATPVSFWPGVSVRVSVWEA